ncbi:MAG: glucosaminidase domain-containing protein [Schaedlerella sp.]|nr:glucosaminidase domain-containing protein [Schaedlerella sp.]
MKNKKIQIYTEIGMAVLLVLFLGLSVDEIERKILQAKVSEQAVLENEEKCMKEEETEENSVSEVQEEAEEVIAAGQYPIMGKTSVTKEQMVAWYEKYNNGYPAEILEKGGAESIEDFCQIYIEEAQAEGVRAEVAFAQTMKETGWLQFGGDASIKQYNFAGIGTTGGGVPGNSFPDVRTGVRAQIQHLKAYASEERLLQECVDQRYEYVTKGCAPYVEWLGQKENPLGTGWATADNYGYDIVKMIEELKGI